MFNAVALEQAKKRVPVVIHVGTADTGSTVELAEHAAARIVAARQRKYGRVPLQEVYRMRGLAVKRFPKWQTEQMPREEVTKLERELRDAGILGE